MNSKMKMYYEKTKRVPTQKAIIAIIINTGNFEIKKVRSALLYVPRKYLSFLPTLVADKRRIEDKSNDPYVKLQRTSAKLLGNAFYGKQIENKEGRLKTYLVRDDKSIENLLHDKRYKGFNKLNEYASEIDMLPSSVTINGAYHIGTWTYMKAKLRMLEFAYFLFQHLDFNLYQFLYTDTDSIYMSLGRNSLKECVLPEIKSSWNELKNNFFPNNVDTDRRTPGLFKDGFVGTNFCGFSSKNYIEQNDEVSNDSKDFKSINSKGIKDKTLLSFDDFKKELDYYNGVVMEGNKPVFNVGIRYNKGEMFTYKQERLYISAGFIKRIVLEGGINTKPIG